MKVEELLKFLLDFSELECTSWTITGITWSETSPRLCTVAVHVEMEKDYLLSSSFKDGMLDHYGWNKYFICLPEATSAEEISSKFKEQNIPDRATLSTACARPSIIQVSPQT